VPIASPRVTPADNDAADNDAADIDVAEIAATDIDISDMPADIDTRETSTW
jgi:hypothetical protein